MGGFYWTLQATEPVRELAKSAALFSSRARAIADFQDMAEVLGWKTYVSVDWRPEPDFKTDPEAKPLHDCSSCGATSSQCDDRLRDHGRACCATCHRTDTHGANR